MTQEDFKRIEDLKKEIENYEKILDYAKSDPENFAYNHYSGYIHEYHHYFIRNKELGKKIINLIEERLAEAKQEFKSIVIA